MANGDGLPSPWPEPQHAGTHVHTRRPTREASPAGRFLEEGRQHAGQPTPGPSGRSFLRPACPDPALGLPKPPFPLLGLEAHFYSSQSANGRRLEPPVP